MSTARQTLLTMSDSAANFEFLTVLANKNTKSSNKLLHNMQCEYDPERLIEEVQKRPGIWDFDDVNYRSKETRHKLWTEIVKELVQSNVKVSKSEMRELELQLQKKWKSIRDCFQKHRTKPNFTKRPYIYNKQLQFLLKNHQGFSRSNNQSQDKEGGSSDSDDGQRRIWKPKKMLKLVKDEASTDDDDDNLEESVYYSNDALDGSPAKIAKTSKSVDEFAFASVDSKSDSDDSDKMFLLSLLPHLKAIPEECRLDAKMDMMQVLRNVKYNSV